MSLKGNDSLANRPTLPSWPRRLLRSTLAFFSEVAAHKWLLSFLDQGLVSGGSFLAGVIIGRTCEKGQFGLYLLGLTIIGLIMEFQNVIIWVPYTVFSPRLTGSARAFYTGSTFLHQLGTSALGVLALAAGGIYLSRTPGTHDLAGVILILAGVGGFYLFREYARRVCFAALRAQAALALDSFALFFQLLSLLLLFHLDKMSAGNAFGVIGLGCGLAVISWLIWAWRDMAFSVTQALSDLGRNWSFGKWVLGGNLALFLSWQLYPWILAGFQEAAIVGILAASQGVIALSNPFMQGSAVFLEARAAHAFAHGGSEGLRRLVLKVTAVMAAVMIIFCLIIFTLGNWLTILIYGPKYGGQGLVLSLLALSTLAWALEFGLYFGLRVMGRPDLNFKIELIRLLTTVTLGIWAAKGFGLLGVCWAFLLGNLATGGIRWLVFLKLFYPAGLNKRRFWQGKDYHG